MSIIVTVIEVCTNLINMLTKFSNRSSFVHYFVGGCSAIAAMSLKGVEMVSIHEDIIDGDTYLKVLEEQVLPLMSPWPGEKSVLFSDNAPVHNKAAIMTLCQLYNVIAVFFEPFSYDYNPIELVCHSAKHFCRHSWPADDPRILVSKKFEYALMNCIDGETARNYFAHCHIKISQEERYHESGK